MGVTTKLPWGGGDGTVHSSPLSFHGLISAFLPQNRLWMKLMANGIWESPSMKALIVMNWFIGAKGCMNSYCMGS